MQLYWGRDGARERDKVLWDVFAPQLRFDTPFGSVGLRLMQSYFLFSPTATIPQGEGPKRRGGGVCDGHGERDAGHAGA